MKNVVDVKNVKCARCYKPLGTRNLTYRNGEFYHISCWKEGERLLSNAARLAAVLNDQTRPKVSS